MLQQQGFIDDLKRALKDIQNTELLDPTACRTILPQNVMETL
jgi:hypothetical protein